MINQIFIWNRFQPIICLTRDLTALDAMLLRPNKDSRAGFLGQFSATPKRTNESTSFWGGLETWGLRLRRTPDRGLKIRTYGHPILECHCLVEFSSNPNLTHLNQLIMVFRINRGYRQVRFFSELELNSAGHRHSRTDVAYPWYTLTGHFIRYTCSIAW